MEKNLLDQVVHSSQGRQVENVGKELSEIRK